VTSLGVNLDYDLELLKIAGTYEIGVSGSFDEALLHLPLNPHDKLPITSIELDERNFTLGGFGYQDLVFAA
jgi:hypothetical protein